MLLVLCPITFICFLNHKSKSKTKKEQSSLLVPESEILQGIKSASAHSINKASGQKGHHLGGKNPWIE